jgi:purine-nucleoside phosphorylase
MIIEDHINLMGTNPLIGPNNDKYGERFPDMTEAYDRELIKIANKVATGLNIDLKKGVYAGLTGPSYETPAEIRYLRAIGADAAGMSKVPEVIVAKYLRMKILGISCITNMAAGVTNKPLSHQEVMETGNLVKEKFSHLIKGIIKEV